MYISTRRHIRVASYVTFVFLNSVGSFSLCFLFDSVIFLFYFFCVTKVLVLPNYERNLVSDRQEPRALSTRRALEEWMQVAPFLRQCGMVQ